MPGKNSLLRDFLRDFCLVCAALEEQRLRFEDSGALSYALLRELTGHVARAGLFRRLKDDARRLFRTQDAAPAALLLEAAVEAAYRECLRLKEGAFLLTHSRNRLLHLRAHCDVRGPEADALLAELSRNAEGPTRTLRFLEQAKGLLAVCLRGCGALPETARFLLEEEKLVRSVFGPLYPALTEALYGGDRARLLPPAAEAFLEGGRPRRALELLDELRALAPDAAAGAEAQRLRLAAENAQV